MTEVFEPSSSKPAPATRPGPRLTRAARSAFLLTAGGVAYFLGFVGFGLWPLAFFALPLAIEGAEELRGRRLAGAAVWFGTVALSGGFYWVVHLLRAFAYLPAPVAVLGYVLLIAYQGLTLALLVIGVIAAKRRLSIRPTWSLMVLWPTIEFVFPQLFPHYVGNGLYLWPALTQVVELTGILGLTVLYGAVSGAISETVSAFVRRRPWPRAPLAVASTLLVAFAGYGQQRLAQIDESLADAPRLRVGLIQTNIGARAIRSPATGFGRRHREMSEALVAEDSDLDLIVWPESAHDHLLARNVPNVRSEVTGGLEVPLLFGANSYEVPADGGLPRVYNSAFLADADGSIIGRFDKVELLMFGETVPLANVFPQIQDWLPAGLLTPGDRYTLLELPQVSLLPMVCYEDILPAFVRKMWQRAGPADVLVNITNDSWYGDTHEPEIHLALATFRAIETRRALIRSTNTGISAIVDPAGRIVARTGQWTKETLVYEAPLVTDGSSTFFMSAGPIVGWLGVALTLIGLGWAYLRPWRAAVLGLFVVGGPGLGCRTATIEYDLASIETRSAPRHPLRVAVLPLMDARAANELPGDSDRFVYRGVEYVGTLVDDLEGDPMNRITEVVARHLAQTRVFAQVILVFTEDQAPNADLFLEGSVRRLRGYVEAEAPPEESKRPPDERRVLAEVFLEDLRLRTKTGAVLLHADAGWSIFEPRANGEGPPPEPWAIASEALRVALDDFVTLLDEADLSGSFEVRSEVALAAQTSSATTSVTRASPFGDLRTEASTSQPYGWRRSVDPASSPEGWRGKVTCPTISWRWRQTRRFHRMMGPYQPRVRLWACPTTAHFKADAQAEFPAELLGEGPGGRYFVWSLGKTNWPKAHDELRRRLTIRPPASRYIFEVGRPAPAASGAANGPVQPNNGEPRPAPTTLQRRRTPVVPLPGGAVERPEE